MCVTGSTTTLDERRAGFGCPTTTTTTNFFTSQTPRPDPVSSCQGERTSTPCIVENKACEEVGYCFFGDCLCPTPTPVPTTTTTSTVTLGFEYSYIRTYEGVFGDGPSSNAFRFGTAFDSNHYLFELRGSNVDEAVCMSKCNELESCLGVFVWWYPDPVVCRGLDELGEKTPTGTR
eukprot:UC1_evm1s921